MYVAVFADSANIIELKYSMMCMAAKTLFMFAR